MLKIILITLVSVYIFTVLVIAANGKKPLKTLIISALSGIIPLILINLTTKFSGVAIPLNIWSVSGSFILGLPGTICLLIIQPLI